MSTETKERTLQEIGANAYASILEMVKALECDYDRLRELKEERLALCDSPEDEEFTPVEAGALALWDEENGEELRELQEAAGDCESREDAEERIQEDPLSLEVRSGWYTPGSDDREAKEFNILLATGGPAVRIVGELDRGEPSSATLEVQDWFTPWTEYRGVTDPNDAGALADLPSQDVLLAYARCFYFGE